MGFVLCVTFLGAPLRCPAQIMAVVLMATGACGCHHVGMWSMRGYPGALAQGASHGPRFRREVRGVTSKDLKTKDSVLANLLQTPWEGMVLVVSNKIFARNCGVLWKVLAGHGGDGALPAVAVRLTLFSLPVTLFLGGLASVLTVLAFLLLPCGAMRWVAGRPGWPAR